MLPSEIKLQTLVCPNGHQVQEVRGSIETLIRATSAKCPDCGKALSPALIQIRLPPTSSRPDVK